MPAVPDSSYQIKFKILEDLVTRVFAHLAIWPFQEENAVKASSCSIYVEVRSSRQRIYFLTYVGTFDAIGSNLVHVVFDMVTHCDKWVTVPCRQQDRGQPGHM